MNAETMEAKHYILPAAALVLAFVFAGGQRKRISDLRAENGDLHGLIATARAADSGEDPKRPDRPDPDGKPIDWQNLAALLHDKTDGAAPGLFSLQRRLLAMDTADLLAELDRIAALDVDEATRLGLENLILDPLCKKDPEAALQRFKEKLRGQEGIQTYLLTHALKDWAKRDPAEAAAWLDGGVAAGDFDARSLDGKNPVWTRLEAAVVFGHFAADPAKAEARLSDLPPEMRADILAQADAFHKMSAGDEIAYAEIVRRQLDAKGRVAAIAERAGTVMAAGGDYAAVDEYLDSVYAAPDERERGAERVARESAEKLAGKGKLGAPDIEEMRIWAGRDAPGAVGRLTGHALGMAAKPGGGMDFTEAAALAARYRESDGNDDALHSFLSMIDPKANRAEARKLAETIIDPGKREILLRRFE